MSDAELSAKTARVVGRPFPKGVSGCPGGRPRQDVTELARAHTQDAIKALVAALKNPRERVRAAEVLLNRAWGQPTQHVVSEGETSLIALHLIAAREIAAELPMLDARPESAEPQVIDATAMPTE